MFRLLPRGLPKDPEYPSDLEGLGYFINEDDEIRNIEEPKYYFKYFLTRNDRHNERQREAMSTAIRKIVDNRLKFHGMETVRLPLGTKADEPHIPILVSQNLASASRVIILFGETYQDLAIFAQRTCGGHGGINAGSAVDLVKYIQGLPSHPSLPSSTSATKTDGDSKADGKESAKTKPHELNPDHPGIILANMGQLRWCRREQKALTYTSWNSLTRPSAVHDPITFDPLRNTIEHNRDANEHVAHVLSSVVPALCHKDAKLDVIAIGDSGGYVTEYLDENWDAVKGRMQSLAVVFPTLDREMIRNEEFKIFLQKRARGYIMSESPVNSGIYGPGGGPEPWQWSYGMNIYSLGCAAAEEMVFPRQFRHVVDWMQEVARDPEYVNEEVVAAEETQEMEFEGVTGEDSEGWGGYKGTEERESEWKVERVEKSGAKDADDGVNAAHAAANSGESRMDIVDLDSTSAAAVAGKEAIEEVVEASAKLTLGLDGAVDPLDISCPPERMEPLPSYIKTDESPVSVHLTKEEKAAILQISVLSSPVKEKGSSGFRGETSEATEMED